MNLRNKMVGIDIVLVSRVKDKINKKGFYNKILTEPNGHVWLVPTILDSANFSSKIRGCEF